MSRVTRRKHVLKEMMEDDFELPKEQQQIVRVVSSRGNNLHEVEPAEAGQENFLASMPCKFRKNMWLKRGDFVVVDPIEEGNKVKAEISKILTPDHVREFMKAGVWPKQFTKKRDRESDDDDLENDEMETSDFKVRNLNRPALEDMNGNDNTEDTDSTSSDED